MADGFSFGRSLFDGILPGTPQVLNLDSSWGRIRSVENHNCLDLKPEVAYPVAHDCAQINVSIQDSLVLCEIVRNKHRINLE